VQYLENRAGELEEQRTVKFDVYGFAVFMWELFSSKKQPLQEAKLSLG